MESPTRIGSLILVDMRVLLNSGLSRRIPATVPREIRAGPAAGKDHNATLHGQTRAARKWFREPHPVFVPSAERRR